jgi:transglutaminase-like putative cysteine protease
LRYRIRHTTCYHYSQRVEFSQNEARLQPRDFSRQQCRHSHFEINPSPVDYYERTDYFGNKVAFFAIQQAHEELTVSALSEVYLQQEPEAQPSADHWISWENARVLLWQNNGQSADMTNNPPPIEPALFDARLYLFDSPMVPVSTELAEYAGISFTPNRPLVEAVQDLMARIFHEFTYDPSFTTIATPLTEVLKYRRGVCQDFAHLAIGCLRALGLAVRYVSGYLETYSEPGLPKLVGADASHAWFSVYVPGSGWHDFDPTNNTVPSNQHITLAWGRDYSDVTPLKGIAFGGGYHTLSVAVDVERMP